MPERYYTKVEPGSSDNVLFTTEMRRATRKIHSISDALVNSKLVLALSDKSVWADALLIFHEIFKYLEETKEELNMPEMNALYVDPALNRCEAFKRDLDHYLGKDWERGYIRRLAVSEYLDRLQELKEERPQLLCAYVYHLYMGLLSGGQIIKAKRGIKDRMSITRFLTGNTVDTYKDTIFDFGEAEISTLKCQIKDAMNEISSNWPTEQKCAFINESQMVFFHNNQIVKTVRGTFKAIIWVVSYGICGVSLALMYYFFSKDNFISQAFKFLGVN